MAPSDKELGADNVAGSGINYRLVVGQELVLVKSSLKVGQKKPLSYVALLHGVVIIGIETIPLGCAIADGLLHQLGSRQELPCVGISVFNGIDTAADLVAVLL